MPFSHPTMTIIGTITYTCPIAEETPSFAFGFGELGVSLGESRRERYFSIMGVMSDRTDEIVGEVNRQASIMRVDVEEKRMSRSLSYSNSNTTILTSNIHQRTFSPFAQYENLPIHTPIFRVKSHIGTMGEPLGNGTEKRRMNLERRIDVPYATDTVVGVLDVDEVSAGDGCGVRGLEGWCRNICWAW